MLTRVALGEVHHLGFCGIRFTLLIRTLRQQVLRLSTLCRTNLFGQHTQIRLRLGPLIQTNIGFRTYVARFVLRLFAYRLVTQDLVSDIDRRLVTSECLAATQDTQTGYRRVLTVGSQGLHAVESLQSAGIVCLVITQFCHARSRLFLIRVRVHLRQHSIVLQGLRTLTETVIGVGQVIAGGGAITSSGAVLRQIIAEADRRFLVGCLHILHLCRGIQQRVFCRGDIHIHLRQLLGVGQVLIHVTRLHIKRLQRIQSRVCLFRCRIFFDRLTVSDYCLVVLTQVTIKHRTLQRRFACQSRMRIGLEQLLIGRDSTVFIVLL